MSELLLHKPELHDYFSWQSRLPAREISNPDRILIDAKDIEIENSFRIDPALCEHLKGIFAARNFTPEISTANSLYLDTHDMDVMLGAQATLRDRLGGVSSDGTEYEDMFGLKFRDARLQQIVDGYVADLYPDTDISMFIPYVRAEIERSHKHPRDASELRFADLPEDIQDVLHLVFEQRQTENFVFKPPLNTLVTRAKYDIYISLDQFNKSNAFRSLAFENIYIHAAPTAEMLASGRYVCMELSFDDIKNQRPKTGAIIGDILGDLKTNKRSVCGKKVNFPCMEWEFKPEKTGSAITDADLVKAYVEFGRAIKRTDNVLSSRLKQDHHRKSSLKKQPKFKYRSMRRAESKAVRGIEAIDPRVRGRGRLARRFSKLKAAMP